MHIYYVTSVEHQVCEQQKTEYSPADETLLRILTGLTETGSLNNRNVEK